MIMDRSMLLRSLLTLQKTYGFQHKFTKIPTKQWAGGTHGENHERGAETCQTPTSSSAVIQSDPDAMVRTKSLRAMHGQTNSDHCSSDEEVTHHKLVVRMCLSLRRPIFSSKRRETLTKVMGQSVT